jgi:hypothetical protein
MTPQETLRRLGGGDNWQAAMGFLRREHGKGTSRWLANQFGVSMRTAQKYLAGTQSPVYRKPDRATKIAALAASSRLRAARRIHVGRVSVEYDGKAAGGRRIDTMQVDDDMRAGLASVADLLDAGDLDAAGGALSDAVLNGYGDLGETLDVTDFIDGVNVL